MALVSSPVCLPLMMNFKFLTLIFDGARGADKSAVGAINRPLRVSGLYA